MLEDIAVRGVIFSLHEGVQNFVLSVRHFLFISDLTVNIMEAYASYSQSIEFGWLAEGGVGWHPYNTATGEISSVPLFSLSGQKWAADGSFTTSEIGKVSIDTKSLLDDVVRGAHHW